MGMFAVFRFLTFRPQGLEVKFDTKSGVFYLSTFLVGFQSRFHSKAELFIFRKGSLVALAKYLNLLDLSTYRPIDRQV